MKQLITYFALSYVLSWAIWLPLYGPYFGLTNLPTLPFHHALGGLGPLIASFLTAFLYQKHDGVKYLIKKCLQVKPFAYLSVALLSPFLLAFFGTILNFFINKSPIDLSGLFTSKEFPQFNMIVFFIYNLVFFGFGEEVGWRGFALPRFQTKYSALTSSIILTFFWAIWHWPLFFYRPGYTSMDIAGILGWIFSLLTGSVLLTWLYNSSRASIFICAIFHSTIDIAFTADLANKNVVNYMGFLITIWGILTIYIFKPTNISKIEREKSSSLQAKDSRNEKFM